MPRLSALRAAALLALAAVSAPALSVQAQELERIPVAFPPGAQEVEIRGTIAGRESHGHVFGVEAGTKISISMTPSNRGSYFNLYGPGSGPGDAAIAASGTSGPNVPDLNVVEAEATVSGEHLVTVYLVRAAARRGERSDYVLRLALSGAPGPGDPLRADYADGLAGGPDWWRVTLSDPSSALLLRDAPSGAGGVAGRLPHGAALRNLGCRMAEGRRWCRVAPVAGPGGWVAGAFLREGAAP